MKELTIINPEKYDLTKGKASEIEAAFQPKITERQGLAILYADLITKEITPETSKEAADLRKKLVKVRTGISAIHKTQKQFFLNAGKFVDAWKNKETLPITQMEENLSKIECHFKEIEAKAIKELEKERIDLLSPYVHDAESLNLGSMNENIFDVYLANRKAEHEDFLKVEKEMEQQRIESEAKKEKERLEEIEVQKKKQALVEAENKKLKARLAKQKEAKEAAELKAKQAAKVEAEAKAKEDEIKRVELAELAEANRTIATKLKAKKEAEEKEVARIKELEQVELNKGDSDKVQDLIKELELIKSKYSFESESNQKMYSGVSSLIDKVVGFIKK